MELPDLLPDFVLGIQKDDITGLNGHSTEYARLRFTDIVLDSTRTFDDRKIASTYLSRVIGYCAMDTTYNELSNVLETLLSDTSIPIGMRYRFFFSTFGFKFHGKVVQNLHQYYYDNFPNPLMYKVLSAGYLLEYKGEITLDERIGIETFLFSVTDDVSKGSPDEVYSESCDILLRVGYSEETRERARKILQEYGGQAKGISNIIYNDSQNVHNNNIYQSALSYLRQLATEVKCDSFPSDEFINSIKDEKTKEDMKEIITRIFIDPCRFDGYVLTQILAMVYVRVKGNPDLEKRMVDELIDSKNTCSSGIFTRLMNVFSGIDDSIKISFEDEIKSAVIARLNKFLVKESAYIRNEILSEVGKTDRPTTEEFLQTYQFKKELFEEYKNTKLLQNDFDKYYDNAIVVWSMG